MAIDDPVPEWTFGDTLSSIGARPSNYLQMLAAVAPRNLYINNTQWSFQDKMKALANIVSGSEEEGMARQQAARLGGIAQQGNRPFSEDAVLGGIERPGPVPTADNPDEQLPFGPENQRMVPAAPTLSQGEMLAQMYKDPDLILRLGARNGGIGLAGPVNSILGATTNRFQQEGMARANFEILQRQGVPMEDARRQAIALAQAGQHLNQETLAVTPEAFEAKRTGDIFATEKNKLLTEGIPMERQKQQLEAQKVDQTTRFYQLIKDKQIDPMNFDHVREMGKQFPQINVPALLYKNDDAAFLAYNQNMLNDMNNRVKDENFTFYVKGWTTDENGNNKIVVDRMIKPITVEQKDFALKKFAADIARVAPGAPPEEIVLLNEILTRAQTATPAQFNDIIKAAEGPLSRISTTRVNAANRIHDRDMQRSEKDYARRTAFTQYLWSEADKLQKQASDMADEANRSKDPMAKQRYEALLNQISAYRLAATEVHNEKYPTASNAISAATGIVGRSAETSGLPKADTATPERRVVGNKGPITLKEFQGIVDAATRNLPAAQRQKAQEDAMTKWNSYPRAEGPPMPPGTAR